MLAQVRIVDLDPREPEPPAGVRREQLGASALRERHAVTLAAAPEALAAAADLDEPSVRADLRREAELATVRRQGGRQRRGGVDDEQVARVEEPRQIAEGGVDEPEVVPRRDEHGDVVATEPADLRRLPRLQPSRRLERAHASSLTRSRAW